MKYLVPKNIFNFIFDIEMLLLEKFLNLFPGRNNNAVLIPIILGVCFSAWFAFILTAMVYLMPIIAFIELFY